MARPIKFRTSYSNWEQVPLNLTTEECCMILRCSKPTVQNYIRQGELKAAKHGRKYFITKENLKAFMDGRFEANTGGLSA